MDSASAVAEQKRLSEQSLELATLAGGLAHEIRNPLSTMSMNLDLLAEDLHEEDNPRARRMLKRISVLKKECDSLEDILNAFLQFARAGELDLQELSLNDCVTEYAQFLEAEATGRSVSLRMHLDSNLPPVRGDRALLRQVMANLGRNALEAMPDGGSIDFLTYVRAGRVHLEVIDTGLGMDEKTRDRMFQAFFSTRSGGSGLGLPTVRRVVEAHHGQISCESEPGRGTRFTISLPAAGQPVTP
ncbi:MAG: two-component sensor histidine kinase [Planctomycetaceae bacterium]|nr:two-component sensor histidine kinase [Planctomycetaceae bacterium]